MSKTVFPLTTFTDSSGNPLAGGTVTIQISNDAQIPETTIIFGPTLPATLLCRGMQLSVPLDGNGEMFPVPPEVWPNAELSPSNTAYLVYGYSSSGVLEFGPVAVTV